MNVKTLPYLLSSLFLTLCITACSSDSGPVTQSTPDEPDDAPARFSTDADFIYKDGERFDIRGVVYVPFQPGYVPWEIEDLTSLPADIMSGIDTDLAGIKALGANTVRLWGAPLYCYEAIRAMGGLDILQTIWIDAHAIDFQDAAFKTQSKSYINTIVDRLYAAYPDNDPPVIAFQVGSELSEASILSTNAAHPDITSYTGNYFVAENINASEAFIAEMADYLRTYEWETYGRTSLISYANSILTVHLLDTPFLDFRSQNVYSYGITYFRPETLPGSATGTVFQGWVEELKYMHPGVPLLITETGLSVSPNAAHQGPPNYGYGGNTEAEQAAGILQNLTDIQTASISIAGANIHEYLDAWWKFGLEDSLSQDPNDIEEWFGMVRLVPDGTGYSTEARTVYHEVRAMWEPLP